jgi:hypothetical protein
MWCRALRQNIWKLAKSDYLKLVLILGLAFYVAFIPHLGYPYPVHIDEWIHLANSNVIVEEASAIGMTNPFTGGAAGSSQSLEAGFDLLWATVQQVTGISWLVLFRYFPAVIFMITVLSVYILGRREGFGWEAALGTCFVLTTVRFLGPGFMVPVALGLLFIPLSLFLAFHLRGWRSYILLFITTALLVSAHGYTALALIIILAPYIVLNLRKDFRHSLGIALALVIPFLIPVFLGWFLWGRDILLSKLGAFFTAQPLLGPELPYILKVPYIYGYLPTFLFIAGIFMMARRGKLKDYSLIIAPVLLLLLIGLFVYFQRGIPTLHDRSYLYLMLMMGIVGGYGLWKIRSIKLPERLKPTFLSRNLGGFLCLLLLIPTLFFSIRTHLDARYYHTIFEYDYEAFVWIEENIGDEYDKAIVDPWKGTAFTAISGKHVYSYVITSISKRALRAYQFFEEQCRDTAFLRENGISIVYTYKHLTCDNPDLVQVREGVYLLPKEETD